MSDTRSHPFQWPPTIDAVWLAMPFFVVTVRTLLQPIPPQDYWWHLALGRVIAETGTIPTTNMYLYTLPVDAPFFDQPWLAQWLMFQTVQAFGHIGTVAVHLLLILAAWGLLVAVALRRGGTPMTVGIAASLAHFISATTLTPRTQMFAYPCFVIVVALLLTTPGRGRRAAILATVGVTTAFWANVHGTFVLAPVLAAAAVASAALARRPREELVTAGLAVVVAVVAACITPHGISNLLYPFAILGATKGEGPAVLEWLPPGLHLQGVAFYAAFVGSIVTLALHRREVRLVEIAAFTVTGIIALSSVRGVLWWALASVLIVVPHVAALVRTPARNTSSAQGLLNVGLIGSFVVVTALCWPGAPLFRAVQPEALFGEGRQADSGPGSVLSANSPAGLLDELQAFDGRIFAEQSAAGYLEFYLTGSQPTPVVFVDQRLEMIPPTLWHEYFTISRVRDGWRALLDEYEIRALLVHAAEQPLLHARLRELPEFREVARDRMWFLFQRIGPVQGSESNRSSTQNPASIDVRSSP